jgi:cobalt-zinc-cadmium efflux system outer membrane protein
LLAEAADLHAVGARANREALATPYTAGAELENFAGTGSLRGVQSLETTLRLGRILELGGKRKAREALGAAEVARQRNRGELMRIRIASRTTARFIEVVADQERVEAARRNVELAEDLRKEVARWVAAARNPESDLRAAEIALAEAELEAEHAEHELAAARVSLASNWGSLAPGFSIAAGSLESLPSVPEFETLAARLPSSAWQRDAQLEGDAITARRHVAAASAQPDLNLSVGVRRLEGMDDQALVMSISLPFGNTQRSDLGIREADAQMVALESRRDAERLETHQALFEKYQELVHARTEYLAVHERMLPKAEQALAFTRRGFEAGRFTFASLAQAQRTLSDLRKRKIDAAARYHTLLAQIEQITALPQDIKP